MLLLLAAAGVVAAIALAGSGSRSGGPATSTGSRRATSAAHHATTKAPATPTTRATGPATTPATATSPGTSATTPGTSSAPTNSTPTSTPASTGASSPPAAVSSFYELAAAHQYDQAWALADPVFRNQLGGYDSFRSGQSGDRKIIFHTDRVIRQTAHTATVAIRTTSVRDNGTQQCQGTVQLQNASSGAWLLHAISISCA